MMMGLINHADPSLKIPEDPSIVSPIIIKAFFLSGDRLVDCAESEE